MPHYSVATTKDKLSSLIDKALAGEEVIITRHGKPTVRMHPLSSGQGSQRANVREATERLQKRLADEKPLNIPSSSMRDWLYQDDPD